MTERNDEGRHAAPEPSAESSAGSAPAAGDGADAYARPDGVSGGFEPRQAPEPYRPPPPTVSPAEQAEFGRRGSDSFAPQAGERLVPRHATPAPVPRVFSDAFGAPGSASDGFDPAPGTRLRPGGPPPESPWWKADARNDPWRDPSSQFWLGGGAVFGAGGPAQRAPEQDDEIDPDDLAADDEDLEDDDKGGKGDNVRRVRFGMRTSFVLVLALLLSGAVGGVVGWFITDKTDETLFRPDANIAQVETPVNRPAGSVAGIAKRVGPAVVSISVTTKSQFGIGSGVVISTSGDVLTNNHVIEAAADDKDATIVVTFSNEATATARIVGRDPLSDLAVIRVPTDELTVATLGKSSQLAVGDSVVAIGSPLGLQGTVTSGIVSALNRPVHVSSEDGGSGAFLNAIQTDAPINPGNSGGALVNSSGAVIGINSAAALGTVGPNGSGAAITGIGYAIPIDYARRIALELIRTGKAEHGSIGLQGRTVVSPTPGKQVGGYIVQVSPGGPGAKAGLKQGDVIIAADGQVIQTFDQLTVIVSQRRPGDRIDVTYYRKGTDQKRTVTVTLDKG